MDKLVARQLNAANEKVADKFLPVASILFWFLHALNDQYSQFLLFSKCVTMACRKTNFNETIIKKYMNTNRV